ncbi:MAG: hypothetical protein AAGK22_18985, partial [Acidobacteriota bacterium]
MRLDHGFNAPPSWLFPARAVVGDKPLSADRLDRLGSVDLLLLLLGWAAVGWAFGTRIGCWSAALFGTSYLARFFWIGGSLLRQDWWLAVVLAACLLQKRWPLAAGCALGYAAGVRLFPLFLGVGPLLVWAARSRDAEARSEAGRFLFGLGAMLCILFGLGAVVAGDAEIWQEYAEVITLHRGPWLTNNVGLDNLLLHDRDTLGRALVDFGRDEPWTAWQERLDGNRAGRGPWSLGAKTLALLLFFFAVRRRSLAGSLVLSQSLVFVLFLSTCYYWQMLALLPLTGSAVAAVGGLVLSLVLWGVHLATEGFELRYVVASALLGAVLAAELVRGGLRRSEQAS